MECRNKQRTITRDNNLNDHNKPMEKQKPLCRRSTKTLHSNNKGEPTMSTLPIKTLIQIADSAKLNICQQFVWHNPNKLPGPAAWVTIKRERVKDSFTNIWWYSKTPSPYANNKNVLVPYTDSMKKLLSSGKYNAGKRASGHDIKGHTFLSENEGSIPPSTLIYSNTAFDKNYKKDD
jgi:site-specific DNA-methyltransferase (cytosine-N4-specific)